MLIVFLLAISNISFANGNTNAIDAFITAEMHKTGAPGLAYAAIDKGEFFSGERGKTLRGSDSEVTPETPFVIGSISKSFTALAVMQLIERRDIDLNAPISQYLDVFKESPGQSITLRQLLSHTSGYSTLQGNDNLFEESQSQDGLQRQVKRIAQWAPNAQPGTKWAYSNANYYILGALIETLSGQSYERYIETNILEPLGMKHSFVADGKSYDIIARGHTPWFGGKRPVKAGETHRMSAPVGGIIATAEDVARYLEMMMNGQDDIISASAKTKMMEPASEASPFYGLGWYINSDKGTVFHSGLTPGVETLATMSPAEKKGVVILINAGSGMGFGESSKLFSGIQAKALGFDYIDGGNGGQWGRKSLFLLFAILPILFIIGMVQSWRHRTALRGKSGLSGLLSMWFPALMTTVLAWTSISLIPQLFGVSMQTLRIFSPDLALILTATGVSGIIWAIFRIGVFYWGKQNASKPSPN